MFCASYQPPEPFPAILVESREGSGVTALHFEKPGRELAASPRGDPWCIAQTIAWLNLYFSGKIPDFLPPVDASGLSPFRQRVIEEMLQIPYGQLTTYGQIAQNLKEKYHLSALSAQAVGGAVGANPICLLVPCHRVVGAGGRLTGYGEGLEIKKALLELEGHTICQKGRLEDARAVPLAERKTAAY